MYRAELYSDTIDTKYDETQLDELVDILKNNPMQTGSARDGRFADGRAQYRQNFECGTADKMAKSISSEER